MTESQYFFLTLTLILQGASILFIGAALHYQTKTIKNLANAITVLIVEIGNFRARRHGGPSGPGCDRQT
jgi:hypothetical protein